MDQRCHRLGLQGSKMTGPELLGGRDKSADFLLRVEVVAPAIRYLRTHLSVRHEAIEMTRVQEAAELPEPPEMGRARAWRQSGRLNKVALGKVWVKMGGGAPSVARNRSSRPS